MCESNAYLRKGETDEVVLLNVDRIKPVEEGLLLEDIFGTRKVIKARIKELALLDHKIILEEV
jgi:predicted RNA-binding protein